MKGKNGLASAICAIGLGLLAMPCNAALISVLGGQAVYDDDRDHTLLADANLAASNTFGLPTGVSLGTHPDDITGFGLNGLILSSGFMNWPGALFWIDAMNAANHLGFNDWRLALTVVPDSNCTNGDGSSSGDSTGFDCTAGELGHLFYEEFSATRLTSALTTGNPAELAKFTNIQAGYWQDSAGSGVWLFDFTNGGQAFTGNLDGVFARVWAVRDGGVVPLPAGIWLLGSALVFLGWIKRKTGQLE